MRETTFVARNPRHNRGDQHRLQLTVTKDAEQKHLEAELVDVSRNGICFLTDHPFFSRHDHVHLKLVDPQSDFRMEVNCEIRWQRIEGEQFSIGCQFDEELSWETLGEMFLNGILSTS